MSDIKPQSDTDAVLTSVRRLVAHGTEADEHDDDDTEADVPAEKLLLTPAFRIDKPRKATRTPTFIRQPREPSALELRIAELERAVGSQPGEWEPDGSEAVDEETPHRFVFQHEPVSDGVGGAAGPVARPDEPTIVGADVKPRLVFEEPDAPIEEELPAVAESLIDEAALREIVAQMVRAELQGELGERITRNVRKLVRREIHRALLTRDIE